MSDVFRRVLEAFFRHVLLVLIPIIVLPLVTTAAALAAPPSYESRANVWAERPTYLSFRNDLDQYTAPADLQARRLVELLRTRSFTYDIVRRTDFAFLVEARDGDEAIQRLLSTLDVLPGGKNLLTLRYRGSQAAVAHQVLTGTLEAFKARLAAEGTTQAQLAIDFYSSRVQEAQDQATQSTEALRRYLAERPAASARPGTTPTTVDLELAQLQRQSTQDQVELERARGSLDQAQREVAAAKTGQALFFQIVDPPQMPTSPVRDLRKLLVLPILGVVSALVLSITILVLLAAGDRTVRTAGDLQLPVSVSVVVPHLERWGRRWRGPRPTVREAVGARSNR